MDILTSHKFKKWGKKSLLFLIVLLCLWPLYMLSSLIWIRYSGGPVHLKLNFILHTSSFEKIVKSMEQQDEIKLICEYSDFLYIAVDNTSYKIMNPEDKTVTFQRLKEKKVNVMQIEEIFSLLSKTGCDCIEKYEDYIELSVSGFLDKTYGYLYLTKGPPNKQYLDKIKKEFGRDHHITRELDISEIEKDWYRFQYAI